MMYGNRCAAGNRPPAHNPTDTAGLKCPPEMGPNVYAPVSTVSPNASETPRRPIPTPGKVAARTALPHPPRTSQNVPRNSAASFCVIIPPSRIEKPAPVFWLSRPLVPEPAACVDPVHALARQDIKGAAYFGSCALRPTPAATRDIVPGVYQERRSRLA